MVSIDEVIRARIRPPQKRIEWFGWRSPLVSIAQLILLFGSIIWLVLVGADAMEYNWQWYRVQQFIYRIQDGEFVWGQLIQGLMVTLELAAYSTVLSLVISLVTALLRLSDSYSGRVLATIYLEAIRNTPMLVQLFLFYFVLAPILGIDRFWAGVLSLSFFEASFGSEIIRAGLQSVSRGQYEAADAIGLKRLDRLRYVILPQAMPLIYPPMTGLIISLIKNSAILSVIAVSELTTEGLNIISETFMAFEIWFTVAAIYLTITVSLSIFVSWLEHRARRGR